MKNGKSIIVVVLAAFLFSISSVCASEMDNVIASEDTDSIELSTDNDIIGDNLQTTEENSGSTLTDTDVLDDDSATYTDLADEILQPGNIKLTHKNYTYDEGATAITITEDNKIIDGDGAVIDMKGSSIRAFDVRSSGVTIKNLAIKNANYDGDGGTIYFDQGGTVANCNFVNNIAKYGGAVYFCSSTNFNKVTNCNFTNNTATRTAGAVYLFEGSVENCYFVNNFAIDRSSWGHGGAISTNCANVRNCNFTNNNAYMGGAVYFSGNGEMTNGSFVNNSAVYGGALFFVAERGSVANCIFDNNYAYYNAGAIYSDYSGGVASDTCIFKTPSDTMYKTYTLAPTLHADNFTAFQGLGKKFTFDLRTNISSIPVTNGIISISVYIKNNNDWVGNYSCLSAEGWIVDLPVGSYYAIFDTGYIGFQPINRTITIVPSITFSALNFAINGNSNPVINLTGNFYFDSANDTDFLNGIVINRPVTINGNGCTIDAKGKARIFEVRCNDVVLENITFINGYTADGDAVVYFSQSGGIINCNVIGNEGAVYFNSNGEVTNCNFTNNTASRDGGAVRMYSGTVSNCNFADNSVSSNGGAVYFSSSGTVLNCNFVNNSASGEGGAIRFGSSGTVLNCNFTNNTAYCGGSVYFSSNGEVRNCNFTNNTVSSNGGAVYFRSSGTVLNCNFTGNNATVGSAIYFNNIYSANTKTISNSIFLNNRASAEELQVIINENNITIIFKGNNNILNAIYSNGDVEVTFTNVTYWGANGIANTDSSTPSRSKNEVGQNITVAIVVNDILVFNDVKVTDNNGMIVLPIIANDNYYISVHHDTNSYYTEVEKIISNITFNVNVTSQTTHNKTVNITARSNTFREIMEAKLLFIFPDGESVVANYAGNGTWWTLHTFDDYGNYQVNATCIGLDNVTVANATISISKTPTEILVVNETLDLFVGDCVGAGATLTPENAGNLTFTSSDVSVVKVEEGKIRAVGEGTASITVSFSGSEDYTPCENRIITVHVKRAATCMTVENITAHPGDNVNISIIIVSDDELPLNVKVNITLPDGKTTAVEIINGKANVTWQVPQDFADGNYSVATNYKGDNRYMPCVGEGSIKIIRYGSKVTISPIADAVYGNNVTIKYRIENKTNVTIRIDGVSDDKIIIINDTITVAGLDAGTYTITVLNNESRRNYGSWDVKTFNVGRMTTNISAEAITTSYNANKNLIITLKDSAGKALTGLEVTVNLNGAKTYVTDVNGQVKIATKNLAAKTYTAKITFNGNTNYGNSTKDASVTVKKAANPLKVKGKTVKIKFKKLKKKAQKLKVKKVVKFTKKGVGSLTFKKVKGNKKIKVNKKTGKITIKKGLKKGTYKVKMKIRAKGNSNYKASSYKSVTFKIKVK